MSILDFIEEADLLEIDGFSIRYFGLEEEEMASEDPGACVLHLEVEAEYHKYEWLISRKELEEAIYDPLQEGWRVQVSGEESVIRLFRCTPIMPMPAKTESEEAVV